MFNDDYNKESDSLDNDAKKTFISKSCEQLFLKYLDNHSIVYKEKNSIYTLKKDESRQLQSLLTALKYQGKNASIVIQQKTALRGLTKVDKFNFSFELLVNGKKNIELISIAHPLMKIISDDSQCDFDNFSFVSSNMEGNFAVVYKTEFKSFKSSINHKVLILDSEFNRVQDIDYYTFYENSKSIEKHSDSSKLKQVKDLSQKTISEDFNKSLEHEKMIASETLKKKKKALLKHFSKKRKIAATAEKRAIQTDIIRMRQSQLGNVNDLEKNRIRQLERKMKVSGSFQILSVIGMV
jgi:hypothetical protein